MGAPKKPAEPPAEAEAPLPSARELAQRGLSADGVTIAVAPSGLPYVVIDGQHQGMTPMVMRVAKAALMAVFGPDAVPPPAPPKAVTSTIPTMQLRGQPDPLEVAIMRTRQAVASQDGYGGPKMSDPSVQAKQAEEAGRVGEQAAPMEP